MMTKAKHLYIHVPFCKTICSYCDFCHVVYNTDLANKWLLRVKEDIANLENNQFETIYIGGGTPNSLSDEQLDTLLSYLDIYSKEVIEYTIELNPEDITTSKINILIKHHINRVSVGLQSSEDRLLKMMNRHYTFKEFAEKIKLLTDNGIHNISIDVMYSLPSQTMEDLKNTLEDVINLNVPHVSLYSLTIEPNTAFAKLGYKHLDDEIEADMYGYITNFLSKHGYEHYEISNFAKKGYKSLHNIGYWNYDDFIGISSGSSSKVNHKRYTFTKNINDYLNSKNLYSEYIELSVKDEMFENIMMSLRTNAGLDLELFKNRYGCDFLDVYKNAVNKNIENLTINNGYCICNKPSILNTILIDFLD